MAAIKQHPIAISIYLVYLLCWGWLAYIAYHDYNNHGDGETIGMCLWFFLLFIFLPYLMFSILLAYFSKTSRNFYWRLSLLILVPIPIAVLISMAIHTKLV